MKTFKIRGERFLNALAWMAYVDRERRRHPGCYLPESDAAYALATRFQMHANMLPVQHLWPDARDLLRRNPALCVAELEIDALIEGLERRYRPELLEPFIAFLRAVACGEVTEGDLQT